MKGETPDGGMVCCYKSKRTAQGLVLALCLTTGLRVMARGEAPRNSESCAEGPPFPGRELWISIRHNVLGDPIKMEHKLHKEVSSLRCRWKLRERYKVDQLGSDQLWKALPYYPQMVEVL